MLHQSPDFGVRSPPCTHIDKLVQTFPYVISNAVSHRLLPGGGEVEGRVGAGGLYLDTWAVLAAGAGGAQGAERASASPSSRFQLNNLAQR